MTMHPRFAFGLAAVVALTIGLAAPLPSRAASGDFSLGANAEKQTCRAVERFDSPRGERSVDVYCGAWEKPSGRLILAPASKQADVMKALSADCAGAPSPLQSSDFTSLGQVVCGSPSGLVKGTRRYGLVAMRGGMVLAGYAYPSDWGPLVEAARVLSGAVARKAAAQGAGGATPGLQEIEAVYPRGAPGQGAEVNFELLRRRAYEQNLAWNFAASERDFEQLLRAHDAVSPDDLEGHADILAEIGLNLSNARRFGEADDVLDRAMADARTAKSSLLVHKIFNYQAMDQLNQNDDAKALELALAGEQVKDEAGGGEVLTASDARAVDRATAPAERNLLMEFDDTTPQERAAILSAQGFYIAGVAARGLHHPDAAGYLTAASNRLLETRAPPAWLISSVANEQAELRLDAGDPAGAIKVAQAGLKEMRLVAPLTRGEAHLLLTLSRAEAALGEQATAVATGRSAISIFAHQTELPGLPPDMAAGQLSLLYDAWAAGKDPAIAAEYFETLSLVWDGAAARSASQLAARLALRDAGTQARAYQDAQRAYGAAVARRQRIGLDPQAPPAQIASVDAEVQASAAKFAAAEADLRGVAPAYLELLDPGAHAADLQAVLDPKEGYLRIVNGQRGGFGVLVTASQVTPYRIALSRARLESLVAKIRKTTSFKGRRLPDYDLASAQALYGALIAPVAAELANLDHLQIDVSGALASAPLAALVASPPTAEVAKKIAEAQDYTGVDWFGRKVALAESLGPAAFIRFRHSAATAPPPAPTLVAFGGFDPDPAAVAARIALRNGLPDHCRTDIAHALAGLGALPDTAGEAQKVATVFGGKSDVLIGSAFTDEAFLTSPEVADADVILLATHGVLGLSSCFAEPALLTSLGPDGDGLIEASRLLDRKLRARLVILSACDTAGGSQSDTARSGLTGGGEALSGLARGFLYAGASGVMATQWKIDSAASATEVDDFLKAASADKATIAGALQTAQKELYDDPNTAHPFYWAAFVLVGDGSASIGARPAAVAAR